MSFSPFNCQFKIDRPSPENSPSRLCSGSMQKEECEEWMSIDEDIPAATTLTNLEICKAGCEQYQAIEVDDSDGDECVEEYPPTKAEMKQALDILKSGVQHR
ncbi:hypothetical protein AVEN_215812-1 [Araneus ventricosus]|uniref:Uncharacterized protein n=1 Tax=Araneus ventricosus TaxID=182803 RepID=A0A4Y2QS40_ARAVE|nr:hypothetical protein AVEN_215812-1 [Araneus ventricosus]